MKTRTKLLAIFMTLAMLVSVFAAFPVNAAMTTAVFQVDADNVKDGGATGTYNFVTAVTNVKDGGTIKMVGNAITTDRDDVSGMGKSYTIDGAKNDGSNENWTWTRGSAGSNSIAKFGGSGKTITFRNINFHSENKCQILETGGSGVTLDLQQGVKFTAASGTFTNGVIMLNVGTTLLVNGAVFETAAPAVATWGTGNTTVVLNSGVLSSGKNAANISGAIYYGWNSAAKTNVTFNSTSVKVNDYINNQMGRSLYLTDVLGLGTATYASGLGADDFTPSVLDMTKPFHVTADNATSGVAGTYDTLGAALAVVKETGTVKMINNYTGSENVTDAGPASWSLDGGNKTWTATSGDFCLRLGKANQTVTITNTTFDYQGTNTRVMQVSEKSNAHLVLGSGVTITGKPTGLGIMQQAGTKVTIDGAVFTVKVPAIGTWNGTTTPSVILNGGTLSYGKAGTGSQETGAIVNGYGTLPANITLNSKNIQITDYTVDPANTRQLYLTDITAKNSVTYGQGLSASDFTKVDATTWVTINNGANKYYTLDEAVAVAQNNDVLTVTGQMTVDAAVVIVGKTLTIQGADANASITAGGNFAVMVLHNSTVTVANLKLNSNSTTNSGVVTLGDLTSGQVAYTGAHLILNSGAVLTNASSSGGNTGGNGISALIANDNNKVTVNTGATVTTGGTALRADNSGNLNVTIAGGSVTSSNRGMVIGSGTCASSLTITGGTFSTTNTSAWLIKAYHNKFSASWTGGTVSTGGGKVFDESDTSTKFEELNIVLGDVTVKVNNETVYDNSFNATFTDKNMMYLYVDAEKTTAGSGLGFASQVNVGTGANVTYGVLIAIDGELDTELDLSCDMYNYNGKAILNVAVDALNTNGFVKGAVVGLNASMMTNSFVGRAYATVSYSIGDLVVTKTVYGEQMSASARDFARAYVENNAEIDTATQAVVDYFLANGNV